MAVTSRRHVRWRAVKTLCAHNCSFFLLVYVYKKTCRNKTHKKKTLTCSRGNDKPDNLNDLSFVCASVALVTTTVLGSTRFSLQHRL